MSNVPQRSRRPYVTARSPIVPAELRCRHTAIDDVNEAKLLGLSIL